MFIYHRYFPKDRIDWVNQNIMPLWTELGTSLRAEPRAQITNGCLQLASLSWALCMVTGAAGGLHLQSSCDNLWSFSQGKQWAGRSSPDGGYVLSYYLSPQELLPQFFQKTLPRRRRTQARNMNEMDLRRLL